MVFILLSINDKQYITRSQAIRTQISTALKSQIETLSAQIAPQKNMNIAEQRNLLSKTMSKKLQASSDAKKATKSQINYRITRFERNCISLYRQPRIYSRK
jgi:hypothetical protein